MELYSQYEEEKILEQFFGKKEKGLVVEIGAARPEEISNSRYLIKKGWNAVLVEPNPNFYKELLDFYKEEKSVRVLRLLLDDKIEEVPFYYIENGFGSTMHNWFKDRINEEFKEIKMTTITFDRMLNEYGISLNIDFLSIDVEGNDLNVLNGIDFKRTYIKLLCVESSFSRDDYEKILSPYFDYYTQTRGNFFFKKK